MGIFGRSAGKLYSDNVWCLQLSLSFSYNERTAVSISFQFHRGLRAEPIPHCFRKANLSGSLLWRRCAHGVTISSVHVTKSGADERCFHLPFTRHVKKLGSCHTRKQEWNWNISRPRLST